MTTASSGPRLLLRRPRRRWVAAGFAAVHVVSLVLAYALWWGRPEAFTITSPSFTPTPGTVNASHPITSTVAFLPRGADAETVHIDDVRAVLQHDTAGSRISFHVCVVRGNFFLSTPGTAPDACLRVSPVRGQRVRLTRHTTIVMTVTPRHPGRTLVSGVAISYTRDGAHLWQHGTQSEPIFLDVRVPR